LWVLVAFILQCFAQDTFTSKSLPPDVDAPVIKKSKCPLCGCAANHCNAGIASHLACHLNNSVVSAIRLDRLKFALNLSKSIVLSTACNELAYEMASGFGAKLPAIETLGWKRLNADGLYTYFDSRRGVEDGWVPLSPQAAVQHANVGQLVFLVADSKSLGQDHGHISVLLPGHALNTSLKEAKVLNASFGKSLPAEKRISEVFSAALLNSGKLRIYGTQMDH
jgi:hypothetical protein